MPLPLDDVSEFDRIVARRCLVVDTGVRAVSHCLQAMEVPVRITAVYVTHDQSEAIMLGDQIAVMRAGKIEQVGTFQELIRRPDNAFVAGFLGVQPMNLLDGGTVIDGVLRLDTIEIPLPDTVNAQTLPGQELILGVRPQAARITQHDQATPEGIHLSGVVESLEPDFEHDSQLAYLRTGRLGYAASSSIDTPLHVGDACQVLFPMDHLHFFDGQTQQRLG